MSSNIINKFTKTSDGTKVFINILYPQVKNHLHLSELIFLHGLGGDLTAWDKERAVLQNLGYTSLALDLRGHGLSDKPENKDDYSLSRFAKDVMEVIKKEKIKKPVIVGHCFGGMIALSLAAIYPKIFSRLILVDTSFKLPFFAKPFANHGFFQKIIQLIAEKSPLTKNYNHVDFSRFIGTTDYDWKRILSDVLHTSLHSYLLICDQLLQFDASSLLKKIKIPTLVISGKRDRIFPLRIAKELSERILHAKLISVPNANHIIVINNPTELTNEIHKFLIDSILN